MTEKSGEHSSKKLHIHMYIFIHNYMCIFKKEILELKTIIFEVKNSLDRVNSTVEVIKERLSKRNDPIRQREKR